MLILGLHFGHDASITVLCNDEILAHVSRERISGIKHALALDSRTLNTALTEAQVTLEEIDYCAITSTQNIELLFDSNDTFSIEYGETHQHQYSSTLVQLDALAKLNLNDRLSDSVLPSLSGETKLPDWMLDQFRAYFPAHKVKPGNSFQRAKTMDNFISYEHWNKGLTLNDMAKRSVRNLVSESNRKAFHYPLTFTFNGATIPGYFVHHHMCHASASYYLSDFDNAAIFTHDGYSIGVGYNSGMFYFAEGHKVYALAPHHLNIGSFYDQVGIACGLNHIGPAGKLMGLAGYGSPKYYSEEFVGNYYDQLACGIKHLPTTFLKHCDLSETQVLSSHWNEYQQQAVIDTEKLADVASSAQMLFEQTRLKAVESLHELLTHSKLTSNNLCLSGGTALNCPSNTSIYNHSSFSNVFIEPCCDDGGLSIGAALNLYHNIADNPRGGDQARKTGLPYLGIRHTDEAVHNALEQFSGDIRYEKLTSIASKAASDLYEQKVIALVSSRSEVGPRALGHRSILADPSSRNMLRTINKIKNREIWRPLAPLILQDELNNWFHEGPDTSPYMLYNYSVQEKIQQTAICHIDNTARVQTVNEFSGDIFGVLSEFFKLSGLPILLNTSFNGRDTPIVEYPEAAIDVFLQQNIDVMYLHDYRVVREA